MTVSRSRSVTALAFGNRNRFAAFALRLSCSRVAVSPAVAAMQLSTISLPAVPPARPRIDTFDPDDGSAVRRIKEADEDGSQLFVVLVTVDDTKPDGLFQPLAPAATFVQTSPSTAMYCDERGELSSADSELGSAAVESSICQLPLFPA